MQERPWRTSLPHPPAQRSWWGSTVTPFAANLAVLLYKIPGQGQILVRLLWNERAIPIPFCSDQLSCTLETFVVRFRNGCHLTNSVNAHLAKEALASNSMPFS